jgi:hypothetical protein
MNSNNKGTPLKPFEKKKARNNSGTSNSGGNTDVTEWLVYELNIQLNSGYLANPLADCVVGGYECTYGALGGLYGSHLKLFGNYGRYDIKRKMLAIYEGAVVLCGERGCTWVDYSTPGNIMYGYLSAARGVDQRVSWVAGGALEFVDWVGDGRKNDLPYTGKASAWGDNPGDKAAVDFGYSLYEMYPNGFALADFQTALTVEILTTFQSPSTVPSMNPSPQTNMYPQGYFLNP